MRNLLSTRVTWRRSAVLLGSTALLAGALTQLPATASAEPPQPAKQAAKQAAAEAPGDYYKDAEGKTGDELKAALNTIISEGDQLSYDQVWEALKATDEDPDNKSNVLLLYTGRSQSKEDNGGGADQWNREHTWAKSHGDFGTATGPGTDIHHLRPTDVSVNSTRGSKDFDEGGEELEEAPGNFTDGDSFEPRDEVKGDVARMILYMSVRYEGKDDYPDLEANDEVENGSKPLHGKLSTLKKWNEQDPPSDFEKNRNEVIFEKFQHNRNPFIDHPEWVKEIWG
ncbi:endonuclease I family protein [Streptomyces sp. NPDC048172]|uniref:endonuclease I family protein n=1 Tax=Streptomyces sp. NPDC048172 TaxID=3365505 RepID=UPI003717181C